MWRKRRLLDSIAQAAIRSASTDLAKPRSNTGPPPSILRRPDIDNAFK
jgi:hypothetical protein